MLREDMEELAWRLSVVEANPLSAVLYGILAEISLKNHEYTLGG